MSTRANKVKEEKITKKKKINISTLYARKHDTPLKCKQKVDRKEKENNKYIYICLT